MSAGHIRPRGPGAWELKYDLGRDPLTGKRIVKYKTVRGTKRDAQRELRELLGAVDRGQHVDASKRTVADHLRARLDQWQASGQIGTRTAENRAGMIERHIVPYIGALELQKLRPSMSRTGTTPCAPAGYVLGRFGTRTLSCRARSPKGCGTG